MHGAGELNWHLVHAEGHDSMSLINTYAVLLRADDAAIHQLCTTIATGSSDDCGRFHQPLKPRGNPSFARGPWGCLIQEMTHQ